MASSTSITYWTRIEPRPRSPSIARALRAEVRDPAWFLARQWQFGETRGADAGSPAYVELRTRTSRLGSWRTLAGGSEVPLAAGVPLETAMLRELADRDDWSLAVELAQTFESMLREAGIPEEVIALYRPAYPLPSAEIATDEETRRFLTAVGTRSWNGIAFYEAAAAAGTSPAVPAIPPTWAGAVKDVVVALVAWVAKTYGGIAPAGASAAPPTWQPERLRYAAEIFAPTQTSSRTRFELHPGPRGELDWYSLEGQASQPATNPAPATETRYVLPGNVRFKGMPNARFWDFEPASTDYGALEVDRRDLARMVITELALTQGNDWFTLAVPLTPGSVIEVEWLLVHDVFGGITLIRRANGDTPVPGAGVWNMFAPSAPNGAETSSLFVLPDVAAQLTEGAPLEEVRFVRDEVANLAWAIEKVALNGMGEGRSRRDLESELDDDRGPPQSADTESPLRYVIQTEIPREWIPLVPKAIGGGQIALSRASMLEPATGAPEPVAARGRIVGASASLAIREEEVPRSGLHVVRCWQLARRVDGTTDLVLIRRRAPGSGEGHSGLRFDAARSAR